MSPPSAPTFWSPISSRMWESSQVSVRHDGVRLEVEHREVLVE